MAAAPDPVVSSRYLLLSFPPKTVTAFRPACLATLVNENPSPLPALSAVEGSWVHGARPLVTAQATPSHAMSRRGGEEMLMEMWPFDAATHCRRAGPAL